MTPYRWLLLTLIVAASLLTGFFAGRASAASRPAQPAIPVVAGRTEAPHGLVVAQSAERGGAGLATAAVAGSSPVQGARGASLSVVATWYCLAGRSRCTVGFGPSCLCAAASSDLHLRGSITVSYRGRTVTVRVVDCLCSRSGLDLYAAAFARLASLSLGRITVAIGRNP